MMDKEYLGSNIWVEIDSDNEVCVYVDEPYSDTRIWLDNEAATLLQGYLRRRPHIHRFDGPTYETDKGTSRLCIICQAPALELFLDRTKAPVVR